MRIKRFQKVLRDNKVDIAFVSAFSGEEKNIQYFIGQDIGYSFLIIPKKGNSILLVPKMEYAFAKRFVKAKDTRIEMFEKPVSKQIAKLIASKRAKTIGINKGVMSVSEFSALKKNIKKKIWKDIGQLLVEMRGVKDRTEVAKLRKACSISDNILKKMTEALRKGSFRKETDIREFLIRETREAGCEVSFEPLVASGKNSGLVHYKGLPVGLGKGFMFIDFGVDYRGYKSDTTRTFFLGRLAKKEMELYKMLLNIQKKAINMVKPDVRCADIDKFVRKELGDLDEFYTHSLGHGVGLQIHEHPNLYSESKDVLKEGMVLTIEPGIYFPNRYGMRVEDTVLVTKNGRQRLTKIRKDLVAVKR